MIDLALLRYYRVFTFTNESACVLRLALGRRARAIDSSDGTRIERGKPILVLHFWNEHLPPQPHDGATLAWSIEFIGRVERSLRELATYLARESRLDSACALFGELGFLQFNQFGEMRLLAEHLGFDFVAGDAPGWRFWRYAFWANLFSWWLMWVYSPASLHGKCVSHMARCEIWMSRATLNAKYTKDT